MSHLPQRWVGVVLRTVRSVYPDARLVAWGPAVGAAAAVPPGRRLELAFLEPADPPPGVIDELRAALAASDLPVEVDLRYFGDLSIAEQEEALQRGEQIGG